MDRTDIDNMSIEDLTKLRKEVLNHTMDFMMENVKAKKPQPSDREVADYIAAKLNMPVDVVVYVRDGLDQMTKKEFGL